MITLWLMCHFHLLRYGIVLAHPNQPLLKLKQSHHAHNLLVNFNDDGKLSLEIHCVCFSGYCGVQIPKMMFPM